MDTFKFSDIERVYFCAGARNHKLKALFKNTQISYELDERVASFKALGAAKAGKLAAVCVTSGTAVAQCVSAMIEAGYSNLPFILISGDRPKRLHATAAPQTIDHMAITKGCCAKQVEVLDTELENFQCAKDLEKSLFPLHINVLVDSNHNLENTSFQCGEKELKDFVKSYERTLFLVSHDQRSLRDVVESLRAKTDYVFAETLSWAKDISPISSEFELLKMHREGLFDSIVRIGHTPLSKLWRIIDTSDIPVFSLDPRGYGALSRGGVCCASYSVIPELEIKRNEHQSGSKSELLSKYPNSQLSFIKRWQDSLPANAIVYLGNSSVIRDFEAVQTKAFRTYGNRGANGIDGQLASAAGLAHELNEEVYCLLGDLTFLYDFTSVFDMPKNLNLVVIDNQGGRIFERIGISDEILLSNKRVPDAVIDALGKKGTRLQVEVVCPKETLLCLEELKG